MSTTHIPEPPRSCRGQSQPVPLSLMLPSRKQIKKMVAAARHQIKKDTKSSSEWSQEMSLTKIKSTSKYTSPFLTSLPVTLEQLLPSGLVNSEHRVPKKPWHGQPAFVDPDQAQAPDSSPCWSRRSANGAPDV